MINPSSCFCKETVAGILVLRAHFHFGKKKTCTHNLLKARGQQETVEDKTAREPEKDLTFKGL